MTPPVPASASDVSACITPSAVRRYDASSGVHVGRRSCRAAYRGSDARPGALDYQFARFVIERGLGALYLIAFVVAAVQFPALCGERGLEPARFLLAATSFRRTPSIFHLGYSDRRLRGRRPGSAGRRRRAPARRRAAGAAAGHDARVVRALGPLPLDREHRRHVLLASGGRRCCSRRASSRSSSATPRPRRCSRDPAVPLARLPRRVRRRADQAARRSVLAQPDLHGVAPRDAADAEPAQSGSSTTCRAPVHRIEVVGNFVAQLVLPFGLFLPQPVATIAAVLMIGTQLYLVVSGNYAWLNWITIVIARGGARRPAISAIFGFVPGAAPALGAAPAWFVAAVIGADRPRRRAELVPVRNLLSPHQAMNASFDPFRLVNTYGAFGTVGRERYEVIVEGTPEADPGPDAEWREYEFKGKPGDPRRMPRQVAPYHLRLDWLMWFLPLSPAVRRELVRAVPRRGCSRRPRDAASAAARTRLPTGRRGSCGHGCSGTASPRGRSGARPAAGGTANRSADSSGRSACARADERSRCRRRRQRAQRPRGGDHARAGRTSGHAPRGRTTVGGGIGRPSGRCPASSTTSAARSIRSGGSRRSSLGSTSSGTACAGSIRRSPSGHPLDDGTAVAGRARRRRDRGAARSRRRRVPEADRAARSRLGRAAARHAGAVPRAAEPVTSRAPGAVRLAGPPVGDARSPPVPRRAGPRPDRRRRARTRILRSTSRSAARRRW